jgi:tetratricopeptide (TPR) repeat protein
MKRSALIILVSVFHFSFLCAQTKEQQRKLDSITNLIDHDKEDTAKVNHLNQLGREYTRAHTHVGKDTATCHEAIELAQKLGYRQGIAMGYEFIATAYWTRLSNPHVALEYFLKARDLYKDLGYEYNEMQLDHIIGYVYFGMDSFNVALKYGFKALHLNEKVKNKYMEPAIPDNIGDYYTALGDYPNALKYYSDALTAIEKTGDQKRIANYLENIGTLYLKMQDYKNAMGYFDSTLTKANKLKYPPLQKTALIDIGTTCKAEKKYPEALAYISKAYRLSDSTNDHLNLAKCAEVTGEIYMEQHNYPKALEKEMEALKTGEEENYVSVATQSRNIIGEIYMKQNKYVDAEKYLLAAFITVHSLHELEEEKNYALDLSQLYAATNELKKSLAYYSRYDSLKDSLLNREKSMQIGKIEAKAEYDRQLADKQAEEDKAKTEADAKSKRQQIVNLLVILIASILLLIAIIIYRSWRTTRKEKLLLEKEKILMELKALRAQMNPHFIFNAINSIQNFILDNDQDSAQKHLSRFSKLIRMVLENSGYENIPLADEIKMLELYLEFEMVRFPLRFSYKMTVDDALDKDSTFIPPLIIQPYLENAIWHGLMHLSHNGTSGENRKGEVVIHFEKQNNQLKCTIDDNGIGRARSKELKQDSVYKSMGLSITAERIEITNKLFSQRDDLGKARMSVHFTDKTNADGIASGTHVELLMPLITNTRNHA